jgi:hypothetical protein
VNWLFTGIGKAMASYGIIYGQSDTVWRNTGYMRGLLDRPMLVDGQSIERRR